MVRNRQALELDPNFVVAITGMGRAYLQMGDHKRAVEQLERGYEIAGEMPALLGAMAQTYALSGNNSGGRSVLQRMSEMAKQRFVPCTAFAIAHCGFGEITRALELLELGAERHEPSVCSIAAHPAYDILRGEPRFQAIVRNIGLDSNGSWQATVTA